MGIVDSALRAFRLKKAAKKRGISVGTKPKKKHKKKATKRRRKAAAKRTAPRRKKAPARRYHHHHAPKKKATRKKKRTAGKEAFVRRVMAKGQSRAQALGLWKAQHSRKKKGKR